MRTAQLSLLLFLLPCVLSNHYRTLGVPRSATSAEIRKAYRKKAVLLHPDKRGGSAAAFKQLNEAHEVLCDPSKRRQYDVLGAGPVVGFVPLHPQHLRGREPRLHRPPEVRADFFRLFRGFHVAPELGWSDDLAGGVEGDGNCFQDDDGIRRAIPARLDARRKHERRGEGT